MKTLFYSEVLNQYFIDEQACLQAEKEYAEKVAAQKEQERKLKETKAAKAKEIEDAYKAYVEAEKKYLELRNNFIKEYGQFHMTYRDETPVVGDWTDFLYSLFN